MRRITILSLFLLALITATANTVLAQSPHFVGTATVSGVFSDGGISVKFKEAGLGSNVSITYDFGGSFVADYGCINHGGNHPSASNKTTVAGPLEATATFNSGKNGTISQTLTFTPPDPNSELNCPGNQVAVLADITYSSLSLADTTNSVDATLSATGLSATFFTF
jgi:hypothetical protein